MCVAGLLKERQRWLSDPLEREKGYQEILPSKTTLPASDALEHEWNGGGGASGD